MTTCVEPPVKEKPMLFSGAMVQALLDGRKTQTRRVIKPQPARIDHGWNWEPLNRSWNDEPNDPYRNPKLATTAMACECPYGAIGDRLWVKETFSIWDHSIDSLEIAFREGWPEASKFIETRAKPNGLHHKKLDGKKPWKPSIFMRREYSRINLEITNVRVERLQDISEEDAWAEGVSCEDQDCGTKDPNRYFPVNAYRRLWNSINGEGAWEKNPWVWAIEFRKL